MCEIESDTQRCRRGPSQTILGLAPLIDGGGECDGAITHTGNTVDRRVVKDELPPVTLIECDEAQTIVCASHGVAVLADSSSDTADAVFVRFDPRGSSEGVSAPTPLPESATLLSAAVAPDAQLMVGGTRSGHVKVWSLAPENAGTLLHSFEGHEHAWVSCVAVNSAALHSTVSEEHPDVNYAAVSGSWRGTAFAHFISESSFASVQLVRPDGEGALASDDLTITAVDVSPDASLVAVGYRSGDVLLWDVDHGTVMYRSKARPTSRIRNPDTSVSAVRFSPVRYWVMIARRQRAVIEVVDLEAKNTICSVYPNATVPPSIRSAAWAGETTQYMYSRDNRFVLGTVDEGNAAWDNDGGDDDWGAADWGGVGDADDAHEWEV